MTEPRQSAAILAAAIVAAERSGMAAVDSHIEQDALTKLRASLGKLIGSNGFDVLITRAVPLAKRLEPTLSEVTVDPGGSLRGFAETPAEVERGLVTVLPICSRCS